MPFEHQSHLANQQYAPPVEQIAGQQQIGQAGQPGPPAGKFGQKQANGGHGKGNGSGKSLAESRGENWALPSTSSGSLGITRPIQLACLTDRVLLYPEAGSRTRPVEIRIDNSMTAAVDSLVSKIWERIDGWGTAGPGAYWKPMLQIQIGRGAQYRVDEIRSLMRGSGISVARRTK